MSATTAKLIFAGMSTTTPDLEPANFEPAATSKPSPWDRVGVGALVWAAAFGGLAVVLALTLH
jgi:hypothetical protein